MTHFGPKKVHGFPVRTPICHIVPSSRIYTPPQKKEFYGHGGLPADRTKKCQAPIKLAQPFPAPELRAEKSRTRGFFWLIDRQLVETEVFEQMLFKPTTTLKWTEWRGHFPWTTFWLVLCGLLKIPPAERLSPPPLGCIPLCYSRQLIT